MSSRSKGSFINVYADDPVDKVRNKSNSQNERDKNIP